MKFSIHPATIFVVAASLFAMATALTAQYGFGLLPCELCLAQRIPVLLAGLVAAGSAYPDLPRAFRNGLIAAAGVIYMANSGLAFYHVGVELHWWTYAACLGGGPAVDVSETDFLASLNRPVVVRCDQPQWIWHGLTMAGLNVVFSLGVGAIALGLLVRGKRYGW